jgi:protein-serine/threonine kinase
MSPQYSIVLTLKARCRNVLYSILDPNPSRRLTARQVLNSQWGLEIKVCTAGKEGSVDFHIHS